MTRLTGRDAIETKKIDDTVELCKFGDPISGPEDDISIDFADEVVREDPSLIYADVELESIWWAWHDADSSRWSLSLAESESRCEAWCKGDDGDGPEIEW